MLYVRTDANNQIASGHVMRCLSIALELRRQGEETTFIVSEKDSIDLINRYNFPYILILGRYDNLEVELEDLIDLIKSHNIDKLLVDSYFVTPYFFEALSRYTKLIYLGSLEKPFTSVDLLINYSNTYNRDFYTSTYDIQKTKLLLGVQYAPLRHEFQQITNCVRDRVENVLITTGNTDSENIIEGLIRYLIIDNDLHNLRYHIVVGNMNRNKDALKLLASEHHNIILHFNVSSMSELMGSCDLAISAAGTTIYELCASGLPTICFSISEEQMPGAVRFSEDEVLYYAGEVFRNREMCFNRVQYYCKYLIESCSQRGRMAANMKNYIDGKGNERIIKAINAL